MKKLFFSGYSLQVFKLLKGVKATFFFTTTNLNHAANNVKDQKTTEVFIILICRQKKILLSNLNTCVQNVKRSASVALFSSQLHSVS